MSTRTRPKPAPMPVVVDAIPAELRSLRRWVCWRWTWRADKSKWDKPPLMSAGENASSTDAATWTDFDTAFAAYQTGRFDGVGFVFSDDDDYIGVDLDDVLQDGRLCDDWPERNKRWAPDAPTPGEVVAMLDSYCEVSPSGRGIKIIARADCIPRGGKRGDIECYPNGRYFTCTGRAFGEPRPIREANEAAGELWEKFFADQSGETPVSSAAVSSNGHHPHDDEILRRMLDAANGDKARRLWAGEWKGAYDSASNADSALCSLLAFWTQDVATIDRLFRRSGLFQAGKRAEKWDSPRRGGSTTYGGVTIQGALATIRKTYDWSGNGSHKRNGHREPATIRDRQACTDIRAPEGRTEAANARRIAERFGADIRWCAAWEKWLAWDGKRWHIDDNCRVEALAKAVADDVMREAKAVASKAHTKEAEQLAKSVMQFAKQTNAAWGIRNALSLARSEPGIPIRPDELDADPWLFNVDNGTLDLRTGKLQSHDRRQLITKLAPVAFDIDAECPQWCRFLQEVFEDKADVISFIRRAAGYSLTGITSERCLFFLHGRGRNGKSTLVTTLQKMMGDYATSLTTELLMLSKNERYPTEICDMAGRRFAVASETEDGRRLAESFVKHITGGEDVMKGRRMKEDFWEFRASHKLWISGNYKPRIRGTDDGIWDRIRLVPFNRRFMEPDKALPGKLESELPGILLWAVMGCVEWQREGLGEPSDVADATRKYRLESDTIGRFFAERCLFGGDLSVGATSLHAAFKAWHEESGDHEKITRERFVTALTDRSCVSSRYSTGELKGRMFWKGIGLVE